MTESKKHNIVPVERPPEPGDWRWLGNYDSADHLWIYEDGKGYVTHDLVVNSSSLGYDGEIRERISGCSKIMGLTGFDSIERAFGWANAMMLQIEEDGEIIDARVDMD